MTSSPTMPDHYPEHGKLRRVNRTSNKIGQFLEWLQLDRGLVIAERRLVDWEDEDGVPVEEVLFTADVTITKLLAEYFEIDLDEIEREKRAMLQACRDRSSSEIVTEDRA